MDFYLILETNTNDSAVELFLTGNQFITEWIPINAKSVDLSDILIFDFLKKWVGLNFPQSLMGKEMLHCNPELNFWDKSIFESCFHHL